MNKSYVVIHNLLKQLQVSLTKKYLKDAIYSHPQSESLIVFVDILAKYKVESIPVKIGMDKISKVPLPAIVQLKSGNNSMFACLNKIENGKVQYTDESGKSTFKSIQDFEQSWTGVTLLVEKTEKSIEPDYKKNRFNIRVKSGIVAIIAALLSTLITMQFLNLYNDHYNGVGLFLILVLKGIGLVVTSMLLWYEVDKSNPTLKEFCSGGKKVNCDAVLNSGSIVGGLTISHLAFGYFFGGFILLLFSGLSTSSYHFLGYISFLSIPIILSSLYLQYVKLKNWCIFCLWIVGILALEFILFRLTNITGLLQIQDIMIFSLLFLTSVLVWLLMKPFLLNQNTLYAYKRKLSNFKSDKEVFSHLLSVSKKVSSSPEGLGISLINPSAKYQVLKVCNPYCGPCAKAHPILEHLHDQGLIDLQILFVPDENPENIKTKTINHILSISQEYDSLTTIKALDSWYSANQKDLVKFTEQYETRTSIKENETKLSDMRAWCVQEEISRTPTIFINGHLLPESYTIEDLPLVLN
ncbi:cysteine peptidase family C39 domain-containing protein [Belliella sp. DSM 111904]|uniref:Cysteine peptidase family C39 domain-containing protein n=1 Tax=Belliella filtrata TaxID=2923435 RepID=A0ABS9V2L6_9BACT|nr:vitamin K epoxide reductase family protein [Belliella filtrata]MCH7410660.1 cysteine peptidase family C39 domain-containing protein [Belliella filtrata]